MSTFTLYMLMLQVAMGTKDGWIFMSYNNEDIYDIHSMALASGPGTANWKVDKRAGMKMSP